MKSKVVFQCHLLSTDSERILTGFVILLHKLVAAEVESLSRSLYTRIHTRRSALAVFVSSLHSALLKSNQEARSGTSSSGSVVKLLPYSSGALVLAVYSATFSYNYRRVWRGLRRGAIHQTLASPST